MEKLAYSVKEAAQALGVSVVSMYNMCNKEGFPAVRIGANCGKIVIPVEGLREWMKNGGRHGEK